MLKDDFAFEASTAEDMDDRKVRLRNACMCIQFDDKEMNGIVG